MSLVSSTGAALTFAVTTSSPISSSNSGTFAPASSSLSSSSASFTRPAKGLSVGTSLLISSQVLRRVWIVRARPLLVATFFCVRSMMAMARSCASSRRFAALELSGLAFGAFLLTPAPWCIASTEGRWSIELSGALTFFRDLSVSMPGEVALLASRERLDGAETVSQIGKPLRK